MKRNETRNSNAHHMSARRYFTDRVVRRFLAISQHTRIPRAYRACVSGFRPQIDGSLSNLSPPQTHPVIMKELKPESPGARGRSRIPERLADPPVADKTINRDGCRKSGGTNRDFGVNAARV